MTSKPVSVLILSNSLNIGGAQRFAGTLLRGLDRSRVRPRLAVLQEDIGYPLPADVPVHSLAHDGAKDLPRSVLRLRRLILRVRPAVVLGTGTAVNVIIGLTYLSLRNPPVWIARVDTSPDRTDLRIRMHILRWLYPMANMLIANSIGLQRSLKMHYPGIRRKIGRIYNPVDFDFLERQSRQSQPGRSAGEVQTLVTVGRAYRVKRWDLLLEAVARVPQAMPIRLVCCGDGPLLDKSRTQARSLSIESRVQFPGHCPNPFSILAQAELFVLSSDAEGLPNALIEAQGLGLCAVATRCPFGPEEIITHGETGLLVDMGNADQMARAIRVLLENPSLRCQMGAKARKQTRERFDFYSRCREWEQLILDCAASTVQHRNE